MERNHLNAKVHGKCELRNAEVQNVSLHVSRWRVDKVQMPVSFWGMVVSCLYYNMGNPAINCVTRVPLGQPWYNTCVKGWWKEILKPFSRVSTDFNNLVTDLVTDWSMPSSELITLHARSSSTEIQHSRVWNQVWTQDITLENTLSVKINC